jgi:glycerol uptake facilitator-like aquaporin
MKYLLMCLIIGAIAGTLIANPSRPRAAEDSYQNVHMTPEERLAANRLWRDIASYVVLATMFVFRLMALMMALEEMSQ